MRKPSTPVKPDARPRELSDQAQRILQVAQEEAARRGSFHLDTEHILMALPQREARVLELRFGLLDGEAHTLKEVGEKFGVTRERIRQIETEALQRLRAGQRASRLRAFLEVD